MNQLSMFVEQRPPRRMAFKMHMALQNSRDALMTLNIETCFWRDRKGRLRVANSRIHAG